MVLMLIEATKHLAVLLALLYLYALLLPWLETHRYQKRALVAQSLLFGLAAVVSMLVSIQVTTGHFGDSRSVIALVAAATAGPIPGFVTAIFATLARSFYPLEGFMNGTVSVVVSALMGSLFYWFERHHRLRGNIRELVVFGLLFTAVKLAILLLFESQERWALFQLVLVPSLLLFPAGFTVSYLLVRRQKRLFESARRSDEHRHQFEVAIQSSPAGIIIYRDRDHVCVYANAMATSVLETSAALVGRPVDPLLTAFVARQPQPTSVDGVENQPIAFTLPSGAVRWFLTSSRPVCYESAPCQLVTMQDITPQRESQQRLEFSEARFRRFAEASDDGILVVADTGIVDANHRAAGLFGYELDELTGMTLDALFALGERAALLETMLHAGPDGLQTMTGLRKDGRLFAMEVAMRPIVASDQHLWLVTVRDLTARQQAEAQRLALAVEQQKVRTLHDFLRSTSHDLRTPLAVINTSLYLAQKANDKAQLASQIQKAEDQVTLLSAMLDGIHDWVHLNYQDALTLSPLCVNGLLTDLHDRFATRLALRQLTLTLDLAKTLPMAEASVVELDAALQALLLNAITYTPPGGCITLRSYAADGQVCVDVTDTGVGMDAEAADHIFEPFYKADPARNAGESGVGLGLALVRRVVDLHRGTVSLASAPGLGTTFTVRLPASPRLAMAVTA